MQLLLPSSFLHSLSSLLSSFCTVEWALGTISPAPDSAGHAWARTPYQYRQLDLNTISVLLGTPGPERQKECQTECQNSYFPEMAIQWYPIIYIYICICVCVSLAHHNFEGISPFIVLGIRQGIFFWHQGMPNLPWGTGSAPVIHWHMPHHALHRFRRGHGTWSCWEAVNFFNSFLHRRSECFSATAKQYVCVSVCTHIISRAYIPML